MSNGIVKYNYQPTNFSEAKEMAVLIAKSDLAPSTYKNNPGNTLAAIIAGAEIGLSAMQSLQGIAIINGKPTVYGDALLALVQGHPECDDIIEEKIEHGWRCTVKRRGRTAVTREFTLADAKLAGLLGKQGPWASYPSRMCQMRARGFALRDSFADVLRGVITAEEADEVFPEQLSAVESLKRKLSTSEQAIEDSEPEVDNG